MTQSIFDLLGDSATFLLNHQCETISNDRLHLPGRDFLERVVCGTDRNQRVINSLARIFGHGRLAGTGYVSILPVDQGIEHSAGASFAASDECDFSSWLFFRYAGSVLRQPCDRL